MEFVSLLMSSMHRSPSQRSECRIDFDKCRRAPVGLRCQFRINITSGGVACDVEPSAFSLRLSFGSTAYRQAVSIAIYLMTQSHRASQPCQQFVHTQGKRANVP